MKLISGSEASRKYQIVEESPSITTGSKWVPNRADIRLPTRGDTMRNSARRLIWTLSVVCALGAADLLAPSISGAAGATSSVAVNACTPSALSQPFAPWLDYAQYELAPGGDFESSTWSLAGGATLVAGSEPYAVTGSLGSSSLSVPAGSSARSPVTCVDANDPSIRFFIAGTGSVAVNVVEGGSVLPVGVVAAGGQWAPTPVMLTTSAVLAASSGGTAEVSVAFTGVSGTPRVDDVFVDPWSRG
jgi:hypothetical protein